MLDTTVALTCARLSQEIYKEFAILKFESLPGVDATLIESQDEGQTDTQAAVLHKVDSKDLYIVFRGTEKGTDWINNFQFRKKIYPYGDETTTDVRFHQGFMTAYFAVRDRVLKVVNEFPDCAVTVTGHSLGGAIATIAALDIQYNITQHTEQPISLHTFGAPRVGNSALVNSFRQRVPDSHRFVYGWDVVTRVPRLWQGFEHVPELHRLGTLLTWQLVSRRVRDHYIGNYVAALEAKVAAPD
ncbi:lipase family protein [Oscillatoria sp. CS-180]|uniref:lipase family protein n=1 Tax=Oscillatoria sp. CS-180 TaxID=3021720 RepID=UPI00232AD1FF|nr:lipase family protein [Oscillatoria sp. CS-180]MDB9525573.1 lipase family protein [Oscillatoria sp. CS-180]